MNLTQLKHLKKKINFLLVQNRFFLRFGPMNFFFQLLELRKIRRKNWGKHYWFFGGLMSQTRYYLKRINFSKKYLTLVFDLTHRYALNRQIRTL